METGRKSIVGGERPQGPAETFPADGALAPVKKPVPQGPGARARGLVPAQPRPNASRSVRLRPAGWKGQRAPRAKLPEHPVPCGIPSPRGAEGHL